MDRIEEEKINRLWDSRRRRWKEGVRGVSERKSKQKFHGSKNRLIRRHVRGNKGQKKITEE